MAALFVFLTACPAPEILQIPPENVTATALDSGAIRVDWRYTGDEAVQFVIYRQDLLSAQTEIARVAADLRSYIDDDVEVGKVYTYAVSADYTNGESSTVQQTGTGISPKGSNNGDAEAPSVTLSSSASSVTEAGQITLTATATDNVGIVRVDLYKNGTKVAEDSTDPYRFRPSLSAADNGTVTFEVRAYDAAGNVGTAAQSIEVDIEGSDAEAPSVSLESSETSVTEASIVTLTAAATDNVGVSKVEFYRDGVKIAGADDTAAPYLHDLTLTADDNGTISFTAKAYDAAGNVATSDPVVVSVNISSGGALNAQDDSYTAVVNTLLEVGISPPSGNAALTVAGNVLLNDGGTNTSITGSPSNVTGGAVDLNFDGSFTFTPTFDSTAAASFDYQVTDGTDTQSATVTITILDAKGVAAGSSMLYYVDNSKNSSFTGTGFATEPFGSITRAEAETGVGDTIFIFKGNATYTGTINPKKDQSFIGEGYTLEIGGQTIVSGSETQSPLVTTTDHGIVMHTPTYTDIGTVTIKGITLKDIGDPNWQSSSNINAAFRNGVFVDNIDGTLIMEDLTIDNPYGSGMYLDHNLTDEARMNLEIYGVKIVNPKQFGMWIDDALSLVIDESSTRRSSVTGVIKPVPFSGVALDPQDEFSGSMDIRNIDISSSANSVIGIRIIKNNSTTTGQTNPGVEHTNVLIEGTTVNLTGTETKGIYFQVLTGTEVAKNKTYDDEDFIVLSSGANNTVTATQTVFTEKFSLTDNTSTVPDTSRITGAIRVNNSPSP